MKKLDQAVNEIANEMLPEEVLEQSAGRVRRRLFAHVPAVAASERIRGCADYQTLIPAYLDRTLSAGRALLLQDHTRECAACRQALSDARGGNVRTLTRPMTPPSHTIPKWWAIAALLVAAVGTGALIVNRMFFPGDGRMSVASVRGILYSVGDGAMTPIFAGRQIPEGARIRTAKDSSAVVTLADGSRVELNERSEISVTRSGRGAAIRLGRGGVIVQAAKQRTGTLDVLTADCTVSVKGTIFAVERGIKGSRVSVVEGAVQVAQGSGKTMLKPGEQATTDASLARNGVGAAVGWSRESTRYLALLGELSVIKKGLEQLPAQTPRHDSKLLALVPRDTVLYAAIPNLGPALNEADRLLKERLRQSPALKAWWDEHDNGAKFDEMLSRLRGFSEYLGDEVVFSISGDWDGTTSQPLLIAEVKKPGLDAFLENQFRQLALHGAGDLPKVVPLARQEGVRAPGSAKRRGNLLFAAGKDVLAVSWDPNQITDVAGRLERPSAKPDRGLLASVKQVYDGGVGYLLAVDMERIVNAVSDRHKETRDLKAGMGFDSMRHLIVERKDVAGKTENQATLTFSGRRRGIAGWLAEPSPMGSLDFVSPNATFAISAVLRSPQWMLGDVLRAIAERVPDFQANLDKFRQETGIQVTPELGEPLGGEMTFALDGPLLPLPAWKFVIEVYNPDRLQSSIEQIVTAVNAKPGCPECTVSLKKEQVGTRTYYTLSTPRFTYEIDYTYVDGYLVAAPSRALLNTAIQNRATGFTLGRSENFRSQLPVNGNLDFSALVYQNVGTTLKPIAEQLANTAVATADQRKSIAALAENSGPGLLYAIGKPDSIVIASTGAFFGLDLNTLSLPALIRMKR
jgi:hypothetical protein